MQHKFLWILIAMCVWMIGLFTYLVLKVNTAEAADVCFSTNLSFGDSSVDVRSMQRLLDFDPATEVAASGPGSHLNETNTFGALTRDAVNRFQEKYAYEILFPLGLHAPTGFVGPSTRAQLNALCQ